MLIGGKVLAERPGGNPAATRLTTLNAAVLDKIDVVEPEEFELKSGPVTLQCWVIKPPGFKPGKKENKLGLRASDTSEVLFSDCHIPAGNLLGQEGDGFKNSLQILDGGRISIAALGLGMAQGAYEPGTTTRTGEWKEYFDQNGSPQQWKKTYVGGTWDQTKDWREWNADGSISSCRLTQWRNRNWRPAGTATPSASSPWPTDRSSSPFTSEVWFEQDHRDHCEARRPDHRRNERVHRCFLPRRQPIHRTGAGPARE